MTLYLFGGITILFENGYTHVQYMRYIYVRILLEYLWAFQGITWLLQ